MHFFEQLQAQKYRLLGESREDACARIARAGATDGEHERRLHDIFVDQRFLPAGRIQTALGTHRAVTPYNCFVSGTIADNYCESDGIMARAWEAAKTLRTGGGIGYDFSTLRHRGQLIKTLGSMASGPVSFMPIFDGVGAATSSAGERRGAQMGVLRIDHPDVELFIEAKCNTNKLTAFNISVAVTDAFMKALHEGTDYDLIFEGRVVGRKSAAAVWDKLMRATWDWAEPGVIFIDRVNRDNPLYYCETIAATNPCGEQPLPPYGACLLGSFNLTRYLWPKGDVMTFRFDRLREDVAQIVPFMDNIIDRAIYPLPQHETEAKAKRRMGLGITGYANAAEAHGVEYGSKPALTFLREAMSIIANTAYYTSAQLAHQRGAFPLFDREKYKAGNFFRRLSPLVQEAIHRHGLRNSHLTSIAPTGTISMAAGNVSSGIEPVFALEQKRTVRMIEGETEITLKDWAWDKLGIRGKLAVECTIADHVNTLIEAQWYSDSAVSKTCNVSPTMPWAEFKQVYVDAWRRGAKGLTTFNPGGKRMALLTAVDSPPAPSAAEGAACRYDPATGTKTCE